MVNNLPLIQFPNPITAEKMAPNTLANIVIQGLTGQKTPNLMFLSTVPTQNSVAIPLGPNIGDKGENKNGNNKENNGENKNGNNKENNGENKALKNGGNVNNNKEKQRKESFGNKVKKPKF
jgi:hypothetical protein